MKSNKKSPKPKNKSSHLKKTQDDLHLYSKEEILKLKEAYKSGALKFNAKDIAEAILKDTHKGLIK